MKFGVSIPHGKPGQYTDYKMVKEAALECERLGYDSIYVSDHVVPRPNTPYPERDEYDLDVPYLECWTLLSALAVETKRVKLGTFTLCNSFRQPPSLLAKMASTLDHISGGRLIFGIGAGYNEKEYTMYGVPYRHRSTRIRQMRETIQICKKMWTEERPSFNGKYYSIKEAICNPKPIQKPYPPILIGGRGRKLTLRVVAEHGDIWNWPPAVYVTPKIFIEYKELLKKHCEKVGRDPAEIAMSMGDILHIAEDKSEVKKQITKYKPDELTREAYMNHLIGTPDECIERIRMYQNLGISEFVMQIPTLASGDLNDLKLFAEKVMPEFHD
ncbi:MAG: LLM class flavin-dependent oxidoreductase [Candidatus Bathyarchaeota archaeon]|nr:LLM class flavin-dependent oxidoreductase [Candidatus Bathyarchaeota archaeon]